MTITNDQAHLLLNDLESLAGAKSGPSIRLRQYIEQQAEAVDRAADFLEQYAAYVRREVMAVNLEEHPYLPELEQVASDLRAMAALSPSEPVLADAVRPAFIFTLAALLSTMNDDADEEIKATWSEWVESQIESMPDDLPAERAINQAIAALGSAAIAAQAGSAKP